MGEAAPRNRGSSEKAGLVSQLWFSSFTSKLRSPPKLLAIGNGGRSPGQVGYR